MTTESKSVPVPNSKTVVLRQSLGSTTRVFGAQFNLNFTPKRAIIRQIVYKAASAETAVYSLYSSLVGGYLGTFIDGACMAPQSTFTISSFANNASYNFGVHEALGTVTTTAAGVLCLVIEFVDF